MQIATELWTHQNQMVDYAEARLDELGFCYWIAGCAIGKTLAVYKLIERLGAKKVLILTTKAAVTSAWVIDAQKHTKGVNLLAPHKKDVQGKVAALKASSGAVVFVVNYESAWRMKAVLAAYGFDLIVADESHKLKSHNSKTSCLLALIPAKHRLIMTGTPWDDRPTDAYGQVRFLKPLQVGRTVTSAILGNWGSFFEEYVIYYLHEHVKIARGYKNIDRLRDQVSPFTLWVDTEDVLDLPAETHIERYVEKQGKLRKAYDELSLEWLTELSDGVLTANNRLVLALRLHQLTGGFYKLHREGETLAVDGESAKLDETMAVLDEIGGKPTVIFTRFIEDVRRIKTACEQEGYRVKLLVGGQHEHVEWQAGEGDILIANIAAGSTGVNLSRARYCIYYSVGHSRTDYNQSRARVRRPGSDLSYPITYYHILMRDTVDEEIRAALQSKEDVANQLLRGLDKLARVR